MKLCVWATASWVMFCWNLRATQLDRENDSPSRLHIKRGRGQIRNMSPDSYQGRWSFMCSQCIECWVCPTKSINMEGQKKKRKAGNYGSGNGVCAHPEVIHTIVCELNTSQNQHFIKFFFIMVFLYTKHIHHTHWWSSTIYDCCKNLDITHL